MLERKEIIIVAKDLPRLHKFYSDALGLATLSASTDAVRLDAGEVMLALVVARPASLPSDAALEVLVADVRAARERIAACGGSAPPDSSFGADLVRFMRDSGWKIGGLTPVGTLETFAGCADLEGNPFRICLPRDA